MKPINRRKILASSASISAFTISKPATVFGTTANSAIRLGIIGCGNRGTAVIDNMVKHTSGQIIAMADLFDYQLEKAKPKFDQFNIDNGGGAIDKSKIYQGSQADKLCVTIKNK